MSKKQRSNFWKFCDVMAYTFGYIVLLCIVLSIPYLMGYNDGLNEGSYGDMVVQIEEVLTEPCEFSTDNFTYKGSCDTVDDFLKIGEQLESEQNRIDELWEEFDNDKHDACYDYYMDMSR